MREFTVNVEKLTGEDVMKRACECTFFGKSKQSLLSIYKTEHSPVRTQIFWVEFDNLPLASATHLIRHHVGSTPFQLTCRDDRKGGNQSVPEKCDKAIRLLNELDDMAETSCEKNIAIDNVIEILEDLKENSDRNTPVKLGLLINAQSLIDMSKMRKCIQAHKDTREIFNAMKDEIAKIDPDLAKMMVRKCVYRGGICGESKCCGFNCSKEFVRELRSYLDNYSMKQKGAVCGRFFAQLMIDFPDC